MPDGTAPEGFFLQLDGKPALYVNEQAVYCGPSLMETLVPRRPARPPFLRQRWKAATAWTFC